MADTRYTKKTTTTYQWTISGTATLQELQTVMGHAVNNYKTVFGSEKFVNDELKISVESGHLVVWFEDLQQE